jgi:CheY-specific phosphatase CheX
LSTDIKCVEKLKSGKNANDFCQNGDISINRLCIFTGDNSMNEINLLDLREFIVQAISEVFDMMLSMDITQVDEDTGSALNGNRIVGSVSFAGKASGSINIHVTEPFARTMTAEMLGIEVAEIEGEDEIHDVVGETSNMVGGNLKSRLCDFGLPCELSIPSITCGANFRIESKNWMRHEKLFFQNHHEIILVEAFMKPGA